VAAVKSQVRHAGILMPNRLRWWSMSAASAFLMIYLLGIPQRRRRFRAAFLAGLLCTVSFVMGCGGGGGGGGGGGTGGTGGGPVPTSISLASSNAKVPAGGTFTLTATVTSTKPLTGTVNIFQGSGGIVPPINVVNGQAIVTVTSYYPPGTYAFSAQYTGDANNLPSQTTTNVMEVFTGQTVATYVGQTGTLSHQGTITINLQ
jgi:Bacterial Ig-like domain (group 3)